MKKNFTFISCILFLCALSIWPTTKNQLPWHMQFSYWKAILGDASEQYRVGKAYEVGMDDYCPNWVNAKKWYQKSAQQGLAEAEYDLADIYLTEHKSLDLAFKLKLASAKQGYKKAANDMAEAYSEKVEGGLPYDPVLSYIWHIKSGESTEELGKIAKKFKLDKSRIQEANQLEMEMKISSKYSPVNISDINPPLSRQCDFL